MSDLGEIEAALDALPYEKQKEILARFVGRIQGGAKPAEALPLVPAIGYPITQREIDDALDAD